MRKADIWPFHLDMRDDAAVFEARMALQGHYNAALDALDNAHYLVGLANLVRLDGRVLVVMHWHEVGQASATVHSGECGLKHIGAGYVAAADGMSVAGDYLEIASLVPVQHPAEDSVAVEARKATPVHRASG